ncbi:MAG TPA: phage terminase small subunit P27 family, partial [Candidatus Tectomicrobia bacterium]
QLRGSWRGNTRPQEPTAQAEVPPCPKGLTPEQKRLWKKITAELLTLGILTRIDGPALERYVSMLTTWQRLQADIQEHGECYEIKKSRWIEAHTDAEGTLIPGRHELYVAGEALRPQTTLLLALADRLLRLEQVLGMTPSARASIGIELARSMPKLVPPLAQRDKMSAATRNCM